MSLGVALLGVAGRPTFEAHLVTWAEQRPRPRGNTMQTSGERALAANLICPDDTSVNGVVRSTDDTDDDSGPPWDPDQDYPEEADDGDDDDE